MEKILYVTDLDGTLMRDDKTISEETVAILNRLIDRGIYVTYATARSMSSASVITRDIHFPLPAIIRNGTILADARTGEELEKICFTREGTDVLRKYIRDFVNDIPGYVTAYIEGVQKKSYLKGVMNTGFVDYLENHAKDMRLREVEEEAQLYEGEVNYFTFIADKEELDPLYQLVKESLDWICVYQKDKYRPEYWLEICPREATKAKAIQKLQRQYGCSRVVVFGDSLNDISMFEIADEAYAVANAMEELKTIATEVIGDNNSDGVARWLERRYNHD